MQPSKGYTEIVNILFQHIGNLSKEELLIYAARDGDVEKGESTGTFKQWC